MNRGALLGLGVLGSGLLVWYFNPTGGQPGVGVDDQVSSSETGTPRVAGRAFGSVASVNPREGGLAVMRAAKAVPEFDQYVEWGETPDRPAQSLGPDIDADDLSIFESRPTEIIGPNVDVEDLSLLSANVYEDIGVEIDVEDVKAYDASVFVESWGEDLDIEAPED